jgi:hypothetical protein
VTLTITVIAILHTDHADALGDQAVNCDSARKKRPQSPSWQPDSQRYWSLPALTVWRRKCSVISRSTSVHSRSAPPRPQGATGTGCPDRPVRERLKKGHPDLTADELQAAIERAEAKRRELEQQQPTAKASSRVLTLLPKAADLYRKQLAEGLDGDPRAALKARVFLRDWFSGKIRLEPLRNGGLMRTGMRMPRLC